MTIPTDIPEKLLWVDLEMTGLDPHKQHIIEVAAIVTDFSLKELGSFESLIYHPKEVLDRAEEWPKEHMAELFSEALKAEQNNDEVEAALVDFVREHFDQPAILAGNSIHQDRRFIRSRMPLLDQRLHYRMFDVSSFKIWMLATQGLDYEKKGAHRALGDIKESINEFRWLLEKFRSTNS